MTERKWYQVRWQFVMVIMLLTGGGFAGARLFRVITWEDAYETVGIVTYGHRISVPLLDRQIKAGSDISAITNKYLPVHSVDTGHYLTLCYHRNERNVTVMAKDGKLIYAALEHFGWIHPVINSMTAKDDRESKVEYELWRDKSREDPSSEIESSKESEAMFVDTFLRQEFASSVSNGIPLVITQKLSIGILPMNKDMSDFTADLISQAAQQDKKLGEAIKDFCDKNTGTNTIDSIGSFAVAHVVLTEKQMNDLFETNGKDGWAEFYKAFPKSPGIITLSRPGFSRGGTVAVLYMGNQSQWLVGHGQIHVFRKQGGKWVGGGMSIGPIWES